MAALSKRACLQALLLGLAASSAAASRQLLVIGKGSGVAIQTQTVSVAAPMPLGPVYTQGAVMAPVYTGGIGYPAAGAVVAGGGYPIAGAAVAQPAYAQPAFTAQPAFAAAAPVLGGGIQYQYMPQPALFPAPAAAALPPKAAAGFPQPPAQVRNAARAAFGNATAALADHLDRTADEAPTLNVTVPEPHKTIPMPSFMKDVLRRAADALRRHSANNTEEAPAEVAPAAAAAVAQPAYVQGVVMAPVPVQSVVPVVSSSTLMPAYNAKPKLGLGKGIGAGLGGFGGYGRR